ncbi:MAG TPA: RNA 2',3'-cyclic phosphodiesterase [Candidatus Brocadiales bacterium]|nr:RNA 2',3'-cyclic phosphodiesterase [Candidatus Brocadiales bacterium]
MAKLRLFVAIEIGDIIKKRFRECQERLKAAGGGIKWVDVGNIHITLKFLGYVEEKHLPQVKDIINKSVQGIKPFSLRFKGIGGFPKFQRPMVVFITAEDRMGCLTTMNSRLEEGFQTLGIEKEDRHYEAHLTLGRVKSPHNVERLVRLMEEYREEPFGEELVSRVLLMHSQLTPQGPVYTRLEEFPLNTKEGE